MQTASPDGAHTTEDETMAQVFAINTRDRQDAAEGVTRLEAVRITGNPLMVQLAIVYARAAVARGASVDRAVKIGIAELERRLNASEHPTARSNISRLKRPHHRRQFGHGLTPGGGPDGGTAA